MPHTELEFKGCLNECLNEVTFALLWEGMACPDHGEDGELDVPGRHSQRLGLRKHLSLWSSNRQDTLSLGDAPCSDFPCQVGVPFLQEKSQCFSACTLPWLPGALGTGPASESAYEALPNGMYSHDFLVTCADP